MTFDNEDDWRGEIGERLEQEMEEDIKTTARHEWLQMTSFPLQRETLKMLWTEGIRCSELANLQDYGIC